jgi:hypothetical protein
MPKPMPKPMHQTQRYFRFATPKEGINTELKYALKQLLTNGRWATEGTGTPDFLNRFAQYLNKNEPNTLSLKPDWLREATRQCLRSFRTLKTNRN